MKGGAPSGVAHTPSPLRTAAASITNSRNSGCASCCRPMRRNRSSDAVLAGVSARTRARSESVKARRGGKTLRLRVPALSAAMASAMKRAASSSSPRSIARRARVAARPVLAGFPSRASAGSASNTASASSGRPSNTRINAMSAACRAGSREHSRQALTASSEGAATSMARPSQPASASSTYGGGSRHQQLPRPGVDEPAPIPVLRFVQIVGERVEAARDDVAAEPHDVPGLGYARKPSGNRRRELPLDPLQVAVLERGDRQAGRPGRHRRQPRIGSGPVHDPRLMHLLRRRHELRLRERAAAQGEARIIQEEGHVLTAEVVRTHHAVRLGHQPPRRRQPLVGVGGAVRLGIGDAQRALRFVGMWGRHGGVPFAFAGTGHTELPGGQTRTAAAPGQTRHRDSVRCAYWGAAPPAPGALPTYFCLTFARAVVSSPSAKHSQFRH